MGRRSRRRVRRIRRMAIAVLLVGVVLLGGLIVAQRIEAKLSAPVKNAGKQLTAYSAGDRTAQYFVNGQWVIEKDLETLLVIGIDDLGQISGSSSYNNSNQADFMALMVRDVKTGETGAIHLNRDTMTEIPILGVTGQKAGSRNAQLALAYTYGKGKEDSCENTVEAVSNLLYGIEIDHYLTITMDAVPILNDWVGGVTVEVTDDFTGVDDTLVLGEKVTLQGEQALRYVRSRAGLADSTNLHRMERQRQYADAWMQKAQPLFENSQAVMELVIDLSDYHYSDCTADELRDLAGIFASHSAGSVYELKGENVQGETYMEYYVDDAAVQELVLDVFFEPVNG